MKKSIFIFSVLALMATITLIDCSSKAKKKLQDQTEENDDNKLDSLRGKEDFVADIDRYRKDVDNRILANKQSVTELRSRLNQKKKGATADLKKKIDALEQRNNDLKKRMDEYTIERKPTWDEFKTGFDRDMDELAKSLKDLKAKSAK